MDVKSVSTKPQIVVVPLAVVEVLLVEVEDMVAPTVVAEDKAMAEVVVAAAEAIKAVKVSLLKST